MFLSSRFRSFPMVIGAVIIGVVSGKAIFGPPLDEYWRKKLQEEAAAKDSDANSRRKQLTPTMLLWISKSLLSHIVSAIVCPLSQKPIGK
ncbi:hypothetical protein AB3S75_004255 [Citrus x aurantiifolia]